MSFDASFTAIVNFNPRTYVRCDSKFIENIFLLIKFQSTHLREVRRPPRNIPTPRLDFNPRTYVRCDSCKASVWYCPFDFNPRTYVRCDLDYSGKGVSKRYFNPRTYVRCDRDQATKIKYDDDISIHAPT